MPVISKRFADELNDKEMRDAYLDEKTRGKLALQIKENRLAREWSQAEMGERTGKPQSNIARLEDRDIARYTLTTLLELASAFDCGLIVEFVPYNEFLRRTQDLRPETLQVPNFSRASLIPLCEDQNSTSFSRINWEKVGADTIKSPHNLFSVPSVPLRKKDNPFDDFATAPPPRGRRPYETTSFRKHPNYFTQGTSASALTMETLNAL